MHQMLPKHTGRLRGFSMLEVLLAVFVLSIGLLSIMAVISKGLRYSYDIRDTVIATELAQEGVELVRNVRDNDFVAGNDGFSNATGFDTGKEHCTINWDDDNFVCRNNQGLVRQYYLQYSGGLYAHIDNTEERYSRYIYIDYTDNALGKRATVKSFVTWGAFNLASLNTGDPANCDASPTCVHVDTFLTAWK